MTTRARDLDHGESPALLLHDCVGCRELHARRSDSHCGEHFASADRANNRGRASRLIGCANIDVDREELRAGFPFELHDSKRRSYATPAIVADIESHLIRWIHAQGSKREQDT